MDLPAFYSCPSALPNGEVSQRLLEECTEYWNEGSPLRDHPHIPGWSSDWPRFQHLNRWVYPSPRWGYRDPHTVVDWNDETTAASIRYQLDVLGDLKPLLYKEEDHSTVVFRVGQRLFVHRLDLEDYCDILSAISMPLRDVVRVGIDKAVWESRRREDLSRVFGNSVDYELSFFSDPLCEIERFKNDFEKEGQSMTRSVMQVWDDEKWIEVLKAFYKGPLLVTTDDIPEYNRDSDI